MDLIFQFWVPYGMYSYNGRAKESIVGNAIDLPKNGSESHKNGNLFQGVFPWLHRSNDYEMSLGPREESLRKLVVLVPFASVAAPGRIRMRWLGDLEPFDIEIPQMFLI